MAWSLESAWIISFFLLHGSGHRFLAFYNHHLRIAFFRHFGSPFTLLWHCIARIHSLSRTDCTAWVCGMGLMHYGVLHRKWRRLLDQIVTSFSFTYLASPIYSSHWWLVLTCTRFPRFPPSFFSGAYCVRLLHLAYLGYRKDTFHALGWVENQILLGMHRRIPLAFP
jgi:hypothetical protein